MSIFINDNTDGIVRKEIQKDTYGFMSLDKQKCKYYIDIGANHGLVYNDLIRRGFSFSSAVLLEPLSHNYEILITNVVPGTNIFPLKMCFGMNEDTQYLSYFQSNSSGATRFDYSPGNSGTEPTKSTNLSIIEKEYCILPEYTLLKCDCEGAERYLLAKDNLDFAKQCYAIVGEYHNDTRVIFDIFKTHFIDTHHITCNRRVFKIIMK